MAYEQLPMIDVTLHDLALDLENYRIPTHPNNESGALKYLFTSEDVYGAATLILRDGYFDNEVPIVVRSPSTGTRPRYVVLEGNRRVSALKTLHNPTLAAEYEDDVRLLLKRYAVEAQNLPERIRVLIAPDRAAAAPHIARLHTGIPKKRWSRDQQANFYYSLIDSHTTINDVRAQYPDVNVVRFIKMAVARRFLAAAPFADHSLSEYAASDKLKMSSFEYAYRNKDIAKAVGVEFGDDGQILPRALNPEELAARLHKGNLLALEYLIKEFQAGKLNTRSPEFKRNSEEQRILVDRLRGFSAEAPTSDSLQSPFPAEEHRRPSHSSDHPTSSVIASTNAGQSSPKASSNQEPRRRGPNHPDSKDTLDLTGLPYEQATLNLKKRYFELRKINVTNLPIATAILMRSVVESTIKVHFEATSAPVKGQLSDVFKRIEETYGKEKAMRAIISPIRSGGENKPGSIQWFNLIAHSSDVSVTANEVHQAWGLINPLLRRLLRQ